MSLPSVRFLVAFVALGVTQAWPPAEASGQNPKQAEPTRKTEEARKSPRKRLVVDLSGFEMLDPSKMRKERTVVGATRGFAQPRALAPRLGKVYGAESLFAWSYEGKATNFVVLFGDDADEEVFRAEVSGAHHRYPSTAPRFQPGKTYYWTVQVSPPLLGATPSEPAEFVVVSEAERQEIENALSKFATADPYQVGFARARLFTDHRLWFDAIGAYTGLIARYPNRAELYDQRGMIYAQLEVTKPLAEKDFSRADELQGATQPQH